MGNARHKFILLTARSLCLTSCLALTCEQGSLVSFQLSLRSDILNNDVDVILNRESAEEEPPICTLPLHFAREGRQGRRLPRLSTSGLANHAKHLSSDIRHIGKPDHRRQGGV